MLKAPKFWYQNPGVMAYILAPLGWLYGMAVRIDARFKSPQKVALPVVSIGNLVMGGSGKTPTTIALVGILQKMGHTPHIITRGYGGNAAGPLRVDPIRHTYHEVGDEALLLARAAPTWVDPTRIQAAEAAREAGATILLLDDAHQNRKIHKDLSLLVIDGAQKLGNGFLFPAGPLREFFRSGMARAQGIIWVSREKTEFLKPTFRAVLKPFYDKILLNAPIVAFSGLGFNQKFHETLKREGMQILHFEEFPDHHPYQEKELETLVNFAHNKGAKLVTTAKDHVRLPASFRDQVSIVEIELQFETPEDIASWLVSQNLQ